MDALDCIKNRRSIRKFADKPLEFEKLTLILEAAFSAPSAGNLQDTRYVIITEQDLISKLAENSQQQYWMMQAPVLIIVCAATDRAERYYGLRGKRLYAVQNAAASIQNILLAANALELGACWIGTFEESYLIDILKLPEPVRPQAIIALGYADEEPSEKILENFDNGVFFNTYGNQIRNIDVLLKEYSKGIKRTVKNLQRKTNDEDPGPAWKTRVEAFMKRIQRGKGN